MIVRPRDANEVAYIVSVARDTGSDLAVRSGGHSLAGHSVSDGGIVLDLTRLKAIEIDPDNRTVWAEAGLTAAAQRHGIPAQVSGEPPVFDILFTDRPVVDYRTTLTADPERIRRFNAECLRRGVVKAVNKVSFDLERGVLFKTYCVNRIRGAILDELRALDWVPRLVRHKSTTVDRVGGRLQSKLGREATPWEMAEELSLDVSEYQRIERDSKPVAMLSLSEESAEGTEDGGNRIVDLVKDEKGQDPLLQVHRGDLRDLAAKLLNRKEQIVVSLYYFEELSMKEIAKVLGLTESRVCQIHGKVIEKLRKAFDRLRCDLFTA